MEGWFALALGGRAKHPLQADAVARILIIEDDPLIHHMVGGFLRRHGHAVSVAATGEAGLQLATALPPELILCDLNLPGLDGAGVVAAIRQDDRLAEVPVIFLSGATDRQLIRRSMNQGGDDFIAKPINLPEILEAITARLRRSGRQQRRKSRQLEQTATFITGILNNLGVGADIQWWSQSGEGKSDLPGPLMERVRQLLDPAAAAPPPAANDRLLLTEPNCRRYLPLSEVKLILADGEYSTVCWGESQQAMFRKPLKQWLQELPPAQFVRAHRSAIINLAFLNYLEQDAAGRHRVHLKACKHIIPVSQRTRSLFKRSLQQFATLRHPKGLNS